MNVYETLYLRDDEMDDLGDSGTYGDSLEEDYEEEEEEEEAEVAGVIEPQPEPVAPPPAAPKPSTCSKRWSLVLPVARCFYGHTCPAG